MKIDGVDPLKGKSGAKAQGAKPAAGEPFEEVLKSVTGAKSVSAASSKDLAPPVSAPFFTPPPAENVDIKQTVGRLEDLLTDLTMFANALGNKDLPLERIEPLVDELDSRKEDLASLVGRLPEGDLKRIASQTLSILIEHTSLYNAGYAA